MSKTTLGAIIGDCDKVGMSGNCGIECYVFMRGDCPEPKEILERDIKLKEEHKNEYE